MINLWSLRPCGRINAMGVLALVLLHFVSCTAAYKKPLEEIVVRQTRNETGYRIVGVSGPSDTVWFDRYGGTFFPYRSMIAGTTAGGESKTVPLDSISILRISPDDTLITAQFRFDRADFERRYRECEAEKIRAVGLLDSSSVVFNKEGGRLNRLGQTVDGTTVTGKHANIPWNQIDYAKVKRFATTNTVLLSVSAAIVLGTIAAVIALHNSNLGIGY